jgi:DnaK suppressor protein
MTPEQIEHFRRKLEHERVAVNLRIAEAGGRAREAVEEQSNEVRDDGDDAVQDVGVDTNLEIGALRTRELEEIDDALLRIELGEYGMCEECDQPIELERLEALPTARLCEADAQRVDRTKHPTL